MRLPYASAAAVPSGRAEELHTDSSSTRRLVRERCPRVDVDRWRIWSELCARQSYWQAPLSHGVSSPDQRRMPRTSHHIFQLRQDKMSADHRLSQNFAIVSCSMTVVECPAISIAAGKQRRTATTSVCVSFGIAAKGVDNLFVRSGVTRLTLHAVQALERV